MNPAESSLEWSIEMSLFDDMVETGESVLTQNLSVRKISHAPLTNVHKGSVVLSKNSFEVVDPATLPGTGLLDKSFATDGVRCYFFESTNARMVPSHFAAAAPINLSDFTNINIFFHPNPALAVPPMLPEDYPDQGSWASLYRYAPIYGCQLASAKRAQIFIMPYVPSRMFDTTGDFAANWRTIALDIARLIKLDMTNTLDFVMDIKKVVVSSFSLGIKASDSFRSGAAASLRPLLQEIWDLDGLFSTSGHISSALRNKQLPRLVQFQQKLPTLSNSFMVNPSRWTKLAPALTTLIEKDPKRAAKETHRLIGQACFYDAAMKSNVGAPPGP